MNPEATGGGGGGTVPKSNNSVGEGGAWAYLKAWETWGAATVPVGNTHSASASSTAHVVSQQATKEAYKDPIRDLFAHNSVRSSICVSSSSTRRTTAEVVQQPVAVGKRTKVKGRLGASGSGTNTRWENHNKQTCKCAVCMQCRGELKSSWYKHDQLTCACAVCRQSRGESRPKDAHPVGAMTGGGAVCEKHSLPAILAKKASWLSPYEPASVECWACSRELPRHNGGGGLHTASQFPLQQQSTFPSCGDNLLNTSLAIPPVTPESCCTTTEIPLPWQQKLNNLAGRAACSSVCGTPSSSSSSLPPTPKCIFEAHHERLTCERRFDVSYHVENSNAEQQPLQTDFFGNSRCSGWPKSDRTCFANFTGNNSDGVQQCTSDYLNKRRSCGNPATMFYNCSTGLSWQNTVDRRQDVAGTSTGLHSAQCPLLDTRKLNLPWAHSWERGQETSSAFSVVTEGNSKWSTYSNLGNMTRPETSAAGSLPDPFLSFGQSTSFFGHPSSMAHLQPDAALHSTLFPEIDTKPVYTPLQSSNSLPHARSGRSSSISQFPFGLEVQAQTERIYQTVNNFQPPIHAQSFSFTCEEGTTESSSPPCETTSTTSIVNEKDYTSPVMDVDSGDMFRSSNAILQGHLEKLMLHTEVEAGDQAKREQLNSGYDKRGRATQRAGQKLSKNLATPEDSRSIVPQKRAKREGVSRLVPKWCQLIHNKYGHSTIIIRKICIRSRVSKKSPNSHPSKVLELSSVKMQAKGSAGPRALSAQAMILEGRSRCEEFMTSGNGLQSTDQTGATESTNAQAALDEIISAHREAFVVPEENIEEVCASMMDKVRSRESPSTKNCFVTGPEVEENPRDKKKIRKLNNYRRMPERLGLQYTAPVVFHNVFPRTVVQCNDNIQDDYEARGVVAVLSLSHSVSQCTQGNTEMMDILNSARNTTRTSISASNDHLGKTVHLAGPLIQNALTQARLALQGGKRSRTEEKICSEERDSRLDSSRHLIPQLKDTYLSLKMGCEGKRHNGASVGTSLLYGNLESVLFKVDPIRTTNGNRKTVNLVTVEVLLPESMRGFYLTSISKVWTTELSVWLTELVRYMAHQFPSTLVTSRSFVPKGHISFCSTPGVATTLHELLKAWKLFVCQKTTVSVTWSKAFSRTRIHCAGNIGEAKETSSEIIRFGRRPLRRDEELLSGFWNTHSTEYRFILLFPDRITVSIEDLIRMLKGASSCCSSTMRKPCFPSFCNLGPNEVDDWAILFGCTKTQRERMIIIDLRQRKSLTQEVKLTPLRNIVFPFWIDEPLNDCSIYLICPGILLKRGPLRLLSSSSDGAADQYTTSGEQEKIAECNCCKLLSTESSTCENLEDDLKVERQHQEQISNDNVMLKGYVSPPENTGHPSICQSPMRREKTSESHAFHVQCTSSTETRSLQMPCASSFQDLLKSVASPPLSSNSEGKSDPGEELHEINSTECSRISPGLHVWERHSDLRKDGPTSAALMCSSDSLSKPVRRRGCPKGGWPKKDKAQKSLLFPAAKDRVGHESSRSRCITEVEADLEVVQSTNVKVSNRRDNEFKMKLETFLDRPFHLQELQDLEEHALRRKPLLRLRETRQRVLHVATKKEGMSYLDYHPDLAQKVADAAALDERLRLLRGFFFWLQHSCTPGAFKPWAANVEEADESEDDCVEIFPHEWVVNNVDKAISEEKATVGSTSFEFDKTSNRETGETQMTWRTRGQKRKAALKPTKSICVSKQMKSFVESTVKREGK